MNNYGKINMYVGMKYSGKTNALIQDMFWYKEEGVCFKSHIDGVHQDFIASHSGSLLPATSIHSFEQVAGLLDNEIKFIAIDNIHLFSEINLLISTLISLRDKGYIVNCSSLNRDYLNNPLPIVGLLMNIADDVIKLQSKCVACKDIAYFHHINEGDLAIRSRHKVYCHNCYKALKAGGTNG